jgi:hypothetical protein
MPFSTNVDQYDELPTDDEAREFLRLINVGREAIGLDALDTLDYGACEPGDLNNCLSARHLFRPAGYETLAVVIREHARHYSNPAVVDALNMPPNTDPDTYNARGQYGWVIPDGIKKVTDLFDASAEDNELYAALRDRLEDAGIVS